MRCNSLEGSGIQQVWIWQYLGSDCRIHFAPLHPFATLLNSKYVDEYWGAECVIHFTVRDARSLGKAVQRQSSAKCTNWDTPQIF